MPDRFLIAVVCDNCRIMELSPQECKILIDLEGSHFIIFDCPECETRGGRKLSDSDVIHDYFEKALSIRTFNVPSENISELEIADFARKLDSEVDIVELAEAGL